MTLFVDADSMPAFLSAAASDDEIEAALVWASAAAEAYCQRRFGYVADDVIMVRPFPDRSAQLPDPPIVDVSLVEGWMPNPDTTQPQAMAWVTLSNYQFTDDGTLYDTTGLPGVDPQCPSWPRLPKSLRVTYSHGFDPIPDAVQAAVFKAAGLYLTNPSGGGGPLVEKRVDDVFYRWANPLTSSSGGGGGFGGDLFGGILDPYRLVYIA